MLTAITGRWPRDPRLRVATRSSTIEIVVLASNGDSHLRSMVAKENGTCISFLIPSAAFTALRENRERVGDSLCVRDPRIIAFPERFDWAWAGLTSMFQTTFDKNCLLKTPSPSLRVVRGDESKSSLSVKTLHPKSLCVGGTDGKATKCTFKSPSQKSCINLW